MDENDRTVGKEGCSGNKQQTPCLASLCPQLAWNLLTPEEQRLTLLYLEKLREREQQAAD